MPHHRNGCAPYPRRLSSDLSACIPRFTGQDEDMRWLLKRALQDPALPEQYRQPSGWPAAIRQEYRDDEGKTAAAEASAQKCRLFCLSVPAHASSPILGPRAPRGTRTPALSGSTVACRDECWTGPARPGIVRPPGTPWGAAQGKLMCSISMQWLYPSILY